MSQLDRWNAEVDLFPEEVVTDMDGNTRTRAAKDPVPLRVWLSVMNQSGTASRRAEQDQEGYETEKVLRMRIVRSQDHTEIGAQAKIRWGDETYSVFGDVSRYMGSPRTRHNIYTLRRA